VAAALRSNEYTKIFVSTKNLSLIHLISAEVLPSVNSLHSLHQRIETLRISSIGGELRKPFAEDRVHSLALGTGYQSRPLN
jgi:hypothetical protein